MIPNDNNRKLASSGVADSANFGLSFSDEIHIMGILRDQMYSDKVLAVLREYSANAWDSHCSSGKADVPIAVTLPSRLAPTLIIRDFGSGLSHDDVFKVYTQYGASTKRGSDDTVGMLGIGSKSAFAYSDSFTITSWNGGTKRVYIAVLDETNRGKCDLVHSEPCGTETGVEIQIAVRLEDVGEFIQKAQELYKHFAPRPAINTELEELPAERTVLSHGAIIPVGDDEGGDWVAVMGCVPYRINLDQLPEDKLNPCLHKLSGSVNFRIGGVQISASREELKYSTATKEALLAKFDALIDEYVERALDLIETDEISLWEKRLRLLVLSDLNLEIPEEWEAFIKRHVKVLDPGIATPLFSIIHNKSAVSGVTVTPNLRLLVDDTGGKKNLKWYGLTSDDYVIRSVGRKAKDLRGILDAALAACNLTGVKIQNLSELPWTPTGRGSSRGPANPKTKVRTFEFVPGGRKHKGPFSDYWAIRDRVPQTTDVFVTIENYRPTQHGCFFDDYKDDERLAKAFGVSMPTIYGYKTSEKKPFLPTACVGMEYGTWRRQFITDLLTMENKILIDAWRLKSTIGNSYSSTAPNDKHFKRLQKALGKDHPIITLVAKWMAAESLTDSKSDAISRLAARSHHTTDLTETTREWEALKDRYPLLRHSRGLQSLWHTYGYRDPEETKEHKEWLAYVQMVDNANPVTISVATTIQIPTTRTITNDQPDSVHAH